MKNRVAHARLQASRTAGLLECKRMMANQEDPLRRALLLVEAAAVPDRGSASITSSADALAGVINRLSEVWGELTSMAKEEQTRERYG